MNAYSGIGSRETPEDMLEKLRLIGYCMARAGHVLRSGDALGADRAFAHGCRKAEGRSEIFLASGRLLDGGTVPYDPDLLAEARRIAEYHHPNWDRMSEYARRLHTRNAFIVLGPDLKTPSSCVICWTPMGLGGGGTGQAIRIASSYGIPVHDVAKESVRKEMGI